MHFVSSNFINLLDFPIPNPNNLTVVARSRMSAHRIAIEMGRHMRPKICKEERICKNCDLEEVEDELPNTTTESQENLFIILLNSKETAVIKALGKYVPTAFKKRGKYVSALELPLT